MKNYISKKIDDRKHIIFFANNYWLDRSQLYSYICLCLPSGEIHIFIEVNKEYLASQRYVVGKERGILIYFSDSWEHSSLLLKPNSIRDSFLMISCSMESETISVRFLSDQISRSVVSDSLRPHESQHARPPCPSPTPGVHWDSRPSSQWCHPTISSSGVPFSSCPQSLPASVFSNESTLRMRWPKYWSSALASFLPKKSQGWSSERTGWISLQSKGLSRVFSSTTVQKHQFFSAQISSQSKCHIHTWPQEKA